MKRARSMPCLLRGIVRLFAALVLALSGQAAWATDQYTTTGTDPINDLTCGTGSVVTKTFSVTNNVSITDVNIGVALLHTYRADLTITLTSPQGTTVTLMTATGGSGDNLSDLFDDSALQAISSHNTTATDSTAAVPPYSHSFRPGSALSAFNGLNSAGTWTLTICDGASIDTGNFTRSDLYITGTTLADLSLAMTSSSSTPTYGTNLTFTITASNAASSSATATGVTVGDLLPSGLTYVSATGTGTYTSGTGVWSVGSLAPGGSASLTITATASGAVGSSITNAAQITASSQPDPDSTVNNGVTSEDDYASRTITVGANSISCPSGSTATGSGYATSGTSAYAGQIFWLDWSCGSTSVFNKGATVTKSWSAGDGLTLSGQITGITEDIRPYTVGTWAGDTLQNLHAGLNPIGLRNNVDGVDSSFNLALSGSLNGSATSLRWVVGDAEDSGGPASAESLAVTTNGSLWQLVEASGSISYDSIGTSVTIYDPANAGGGTAVFETSSSNLSLATTLNGGGGTAAAFGILTPYDYSDAPLTGTTYGAANHRIIPGLRMGAAVTSESTAYNSPTASADSDDGVTIPNLFRSQPATVTVAVSGPGKLSAWADRNGDGDFADAGEQIATDITDGGSGDSDGAVNGAIAISVTPPANATTSPTVARFRWSSNTGQASSGLAGFGEVEDYQITFINPSLSVAKTSSVISDPANGSTNPKRIPGASVQYCVLITNTGNTSASAVDLADNLPATTSYVAGSLRSGTSCAGAATTEDDDATGSDETDPFGASRSGALIAGSAASLAAGSSFALIYTVTIQ